MKHNFQFSIFIFQKLRRLLSKPTTYNLPASPAGGQPTTSFSPPVTDHPSPSTGFTLLELLVVISIIAILITIGITSFSTAQKKGRDSKRKTDLREVQQALESYYSVCGFMYPTPNSFYSGGIICASPSIPIMPTVPSDPRVVTPYACATPASTNCTASGYIICATMESETSAYCLKNQQ